jgi:hypothetical protein
MLLVTNLELDNISKKTFFENFSSFKANFKPQNEKVSNGKEEMVLKEIC